MAVVIPADEAAAAPTGAAVRTVGVRTVSRTGDGAVGDAGPSAARAAGAGRRAGVTAGPADLRRSDKAALAEALTAGRQRLLAMFDALVAALGDDGLRIAPDPVLNLPLWELGHLGWFEERWLARNPGRAEGVRCDPALPPWPSVRAEADALYDSSAVPHARRWQLPLPSAAETRDFLATVRASTLQLLARIDEGDGDGDGDDGALYFFRLVLFHEDMHREAWHCMAQQLGIDLGTALLGRAPAAPTTAEAAGEWRVPAALRTVGSDAAGFAFDNELPSASTVVAAFTIDRAPVTWRRFLPFVDAGGYDRQALWSAAGWAWREAHDRRHPRHLRRAPHGWEQNRFGRWLPLALDAPAVHLTAHEAEAWCRWAGRRLPTEVEWETAARVAAELGTDGSGNAFAWGGVWEWTASAFAPYDGFVAHPYRDYSQPWFGTHRVLRGASFATAPHLRHPCFRNFYTAERDDVFAGFRSCALERPGDSEA